MTHKQRNVLSAV